MVQKIHPRGVIWVPNSQPQAGHLSEKKWWISCPVWRLSMTTSVTQWLYVLPRLLKKKVSKNYWGRWGRKRLMGQKARICFWKKIGTYFFNYPTLNQFLKKWVKIKFFSKNLFLWTTSKMGFSKWKFQHSVEYTRLYLKLVTKQARSNLIFSWSKHLINLRITSGSLPFVAGTSFQWRGSENLR